MSPMTLDAYCAIEADAVFRRYVGGAPRSRENAERKFRQVHLSAEAIRLTKEAGRAFLA